MDMFFHDPIKVTKIYSSSSWYFAVCDEGYKIKSKRYEECFW